MYSDMPVRRIKEVAPVSDHASINTPTAHNSARYAPENREIAKIVLMPGDPLRAKTIAEN